MKKRITSAILAALFVITILVSAAVPASAATQYTYRNTPDFKVSVNGKSVKFSAAPVTITQTNTVLVPAGFFRTNLGISYTKSGSTLNLGSGKLKVTIGYASCYVNNVKSTLPCPAFTINGTDYIPFDFAVKKLGFKIVYNSGSGVYCVNTTGYGKTQFDSLVGTVAKKYKNVSVTYLNPVTGETYTCGNTDQYLTQSTIKAAYCAYLVYSGAKMTDTIKLTTPVKASGSGVLVAKNVGKSYTIKTLINYVLKYSDNQAYYMLLNKYGRTGYNSFIKNVIGITNPTLTGTSMFSYATSAEMAKVMAYIYNNRTACSYLITCMSSEEAYIALGTTNSVAQKYGYNTGSYHDIAIVYDDVPYVLSIFTNEDATSDVFKKVTEKVQQFHDKVTA